MGMKEKLSKKDVRRSLVRKVRFALHQLFKSCYGDGIVRQALVSCLFTRVIAVVSREFMRQKELEKILCLVVECTFCKFIKKHRLFICVQKAPQLLENMRKGASRADLSVSWKTVRCSLSQRNNLWKTCTCIWARWANGLSEAISMKLYTRQLRALFLSFCGRAFVFCNKGRKFMLVTTDNLTPL